MLNHLSRPSRVACSEEAAKEMIRQLLIFIGEDPTREGLQETPDRILRSWRELFQGYKRNPTEHLKMFTNDAGSDELIVCRKVGFTSFCEHHMLPFSGHATIGYIPNGKILGLSKFGRIVDVYAKRLQVQERLTCEIADSINVGLTPRGVGVVLTAKHSCMSCRGVRKQDADMVTSALRGVFKTDPSTRGEFLRLAFFGKE